MRFYQTACGRALIIIFLISHIVLGYVPLYSTSEEPVTPVLNLDLTEEELLYIKEHPVLDVHVEDNWPPFNYVEYGIIKGFSNDYMLLIARKAGLEINFKTGYLWSDYVEMLRNHEIDIISNMSRNANRETFVLFSEKPSIIDKYAVLVQKGNEIYGDFDNLKGRTVAVVKDYFTEEVLREYYPDINLILTLNTLDSVKQVSAGNAVAAIDRSGVFNYLISKHLFSDVVPITIESNRYFPPGPMHIGIRNDRHVLKQIIDKAMAAVSDDEMENLLAKWIRMDISKEGQVHELTSEEKSYLEKKGKLRMAVDPSWYPLELVVDGEYFGISADIMKLLEKRLGISFELVPTDSWDESLETVKARDADFLPMTMVTNERKEYLEFTRPYLSSPVVLITTADESYFVEFNMLYGRSIGLVTDYAFGEILKSRYPAINFIEYIDRDEGLNDVINSKIYGFIETQVVAESILRDSYPELRITSEVGLDMELGVAVRSDEPMLRMIFEKGIDSISITEREAIIEKWVSAEDVDNNIPWLILIVMAVLLILVAAWSLTLRMQVKRKTLALKQGETKYRALFDSSLDAILLLDINMHILDCNQTAMQIFAFPDKSELSELSIAMLSSDVQPCGTSSVDLAEQYIEEILKNGNLSFEWMHKSLDGYEFPAAVEVNKVVISGSTIMQSLIRDITHQKQAQEKIQKLLDEKEILLKEVHHRIKNNMNVMSTMLSMQAESIAIPEIERIFQDAVARIESMGVLYDKLYKAEIYTDVSINEYLTQLIDEIFQMYSDNQKIQIVNKIDDFTLEPKVIFPLGIILNELLTNSMKYAFEGRSRGVIKISASEEDGHVIFVLQDDGVGMPAAGNANPPMGFGMTLIQMLTEQLNGTYRIEQNKGSKFIIEFDI